MKNSARALFVGVVCSFVFCGAVFGGENIERMLEMYKRSSSEQRLREYAALEEMRRERRQRHLPAGSQFDFARESYRRTRTDAPGANSCEWTSAGPTNLNGRVISIAIDPVEKKRIYAATVGGLWRSETAGRRWQRVSDDIPSMRFGAVAVNPGAHNEILAATGDPNMGAWGEEGIWRSTSFGAPGTWTKVMPAKFNKKIVYRIRFDPQPKPDGTHDVYVAASNGVWLGEHDAGGGITFTQKPLGDLDALNAHTSDVAVDFTVHPRILYAGVRVANAKFERGIYKWDPVAKKWFRKSTGIDTSDSDAITIAHSPSNPSFLYAKVAQLSNATLVGLFRTETAAEKPAANQDAWKMLPLGEPDGVPDEWGWYVTMLEVHPQDHTRVFAGGTDFWMSTTSGDEWEMYPFGTDPAYPLRSHVDVHTLAFDPENPDIIYIGNDGGIDRSTDLSQPLWHWEDVSHGMIITMLWFLTSNRAYPTLIATGTQDNGNTITFGNRTWYQPGGGDGWDVGSDAGNPDLLYGNGTGHLYSLGNPIPGTPGGPKPGEPGTGTETKWTGDVPTRAPLIADAVTPLGALAGGGLDCGPRTIVKTTDGVDWKATNTDFPKGGAAVALASAPSSGFKTYLAAVAYRPSNCPFYTQLPFRPGVIRTDDGGDSWTSVSGLPSDVPVSLAFDPKDSNRSYVTYDSAGQGIWMSTGGVYSNIGDTLNFGVRRVVADPFDKNVLYAATGVGMFRGVITEAPPAEPAATWYTFDEGMPFGLEINDLWVDESTGILTIGSFGFGAFRRDIRKGAECAMRMLVVRDTVYDDGRVPSTPLSGIPDAESPVPESPNSPFYKPDDSTAGRASWWSSRDIRIDVPSKNPPANKIDDADSVEFELCPTTVANCQPGAMIDSAPVFHKEARVYVQVTNRGVEPVANTRVIALWNPSSAAFEKLPETFWTKTFPAGSGKCGPLDPGTGWQLVDTVQPCRTIPQVTPEMPELARFDWAVPQAADGGATMLTITEAPDDTLDPSIRQDNRLKPWDIVPNSRHIAMRSVHTIDFEVRVPFLWPLDLLHLPEEMSEVEVVVGKPGLAESVRIALPAGLTARPGSGSVRPTQVTEPELVRKLESMRLDPGNAWEINGDEASLLVDLQPGQRVTTAVIATPADHGATSRVSIVERSRGKVVGGHVMLLRPVR